MPTYASLKSEYQTLYDTMEQTKFEGVVKSVLDEIAIGRPLYDEVAQDTGVPWWFIGILHSLESNCDFKKHLHNGDPLSDRTVKKPKGRPKAGSPPFSWRESAVDALKIKGLDKVKDWTVTRALYEFERYNGFGYREPERAINSPYLWSGTNHYTKGKFTADHSYSKTAVSKQIGAALLMKDLMPTKVEPQKENDDTINLDDVATTILRGLDQLLQVVEGIAERNRKK